MRALAATLLATSWLPRTRSEGANVSLLVLQIQSDGRYAEADCHGTWSAGRCWLDEMKPLAVAAMLALDDFNARNGRYVPEIANDANRACDKQLVAKFTDSESATAASVNALVDSITSSDVADIIIGPESSAASIPTAILGGVEDIPQVIASTVCRRYLDLSRE